MIILNKDKGLVRIESLDEMLEIPGYVSNLDLKGKKLETLLSDYNFSQRIPCGIKSCHRKHNKGYVVKTTDGQITNIGHICGEKYFGVTFKQMSNRFRRDVAEYENRETLREFMNSIPSLENQIFSVKQVGQGVAVYQRLKKKILSKQYTPSEIVDMLNVMVKHRTNKVSIEVSLTAQEKEVISLSGAVPPAYKSEDICVLAGISVLYDENDFRELLTIQVEQKLKEFQSMDVNAMTFNELREWVKWVGHLDQDLKYIRSLLEEAMKFFTAENLRPLRMLLVEQNDKNIFDKFLGYIKSCQIEQLPTEMMAAY